MQQADRVVLLFRRAPIPGVACWLPFSIFALTGNANEQVREAASAAEIEAASGTEGWAYYPATGEFVINDSDYISW